MPNLRRLSGAEVVAILGQFGFTTHSQRGSHIKLRRALPDGTNQTLTVPAHSELDTGTCRAIVRQASRFVPEEERIRRMFQHHGILRRWGREEIAEKAARWMEITGMSSGFACFCR